MISIKDHELEKLQEELKDFVNVLFGKSVELERLFKDPAFSPLERKAVINEMRKRGQLGEILHHFLRLLIDKGRIMLLPLIEQAFELLVDQRRGRVRAQIKSATPLDPRIVNEINLAISRRCQKEVLAKTSVLPELLGGIRVEVSDLIFDGTVRAKLDALRSTLIYNI
jgi:F-type H+-transporting ATPase subunit delta